MKKVIIIGAGPAGLTAAYELLVHSRDYQVVVLEETDSLGGISKTVNYKGNRMDMGGHRFFSKVPEVNAWWDKMLPVQGKVSRDDLILERKVAAAEDGPDPELEDRVMLVRKRVSRILFDGKFYDYPISLTLQTFKNMGIKKTVQVCFSYLAAVFRKRSEENLENFYINRFGKKLYTMFFEYYTENLWGRHPREIDASWGAQRVKGMSVMAIFRDILERRLKKANRKVETSLIEEFKYPKYGPGELWEITAEKIIELNGRILQNTKVMGVHKDSQRRIISVEYEDKSGRHSMNGDIFISSMPLRDLVQGMNDVPKEVQRIAAGLPYRDYITLGLLVSKLKIKNQTKRKTLNNIVPDCWIYIQDRSVKLGRIQIYNNWSPYLVKNPEKTVWIGLEYFVNEGDNYWNMTEEEFIRLGIEEIIKIGVLEREEDVIDAHMEKVKKAYPAYFDTYQEMDKLVDYLNSIENLYCVGRNGQHRYNNIDHSMCTSFEAVKNILNHIPSKDNIWNVNTEKEYHEKAE